MNGKTSGVKQELSFIIDSESFSMRFHSPGNSGTSGQTLRPINGISK